MPKPTKLRADDTVVDHLLRMPAVVAASGKSKAAIYVAIRRGEFPVPVRVGAKAVAWKSSEVRRWQEALPRAAVGE